MENEKQMEKLRFTDNELNDFVKIQYKNVKSFQPIVIRNGIDYLIANTNALIAQLILETRETNKILKANSLNT